MFIEKLASEDGELLNLIKYVLNKTHKINHFNKKTNEPAEIFASKLNLKQGDGLFICDVFKCEQMPNGTFKIVVCGNTIMPGLFNLKPFYEGNIFYISDFNIKVANNDHPSMILTENELIENVFMNYMYKKFGDEYKKAYLTHREEQLKKLTHAHNFETKLMISEMTK